MFERIVWVWTMIKHKIFRPIDWLLLVAGLCILALNLVAPILILILSIGTVFLANPFATLVAFVTTIYLVAVCIRIIYRCRRSNGFGKILLLTAVSIILALVAIPFLSNWMLEKDVKAIIATDFEKIPQLSNVKTVGIVRSGQTGCGKLCKALLINGYASEVIVSKKNQTKDIPLLENLGTAYAFLKRPTCPAFGKYSGNTNSYKVDYKTYKENASDILRIKAAEGFCLEGREKLITSADLIIESKGSFRNKNGRDTYLGLFDRPIFSTQRIIYVKTETGFSTISKTSHIQYFKLTPVLLTGFAPFGYYSADFWDFGFYRNSEYKNASRTSGSYGLFRKYVVPPFDEAIANVLGWKLNISESISSDQFRKVIVDALNKKNKPDIVTKNIIPDFMKHFKRLEKRRQTPNKADVDLVLEIIRNREVPPPSGLGGAVKTIIAAYPERTDKFASALLDRMLSIKPRVVKENYFFDGLHALDAAMTQIPKNELLKRKSEIKKLAIDARRRVSAKYTLRRIAVFGNSEVDMFFYLIDDAHKFKENNKNNSEWSVPFGAGMRGICELGKNNLSLFPRILERIQSGIIPVNWRRSYASISTILSLGKSTEQIWKIWKSNGTDYSAEQFDADVKKLKRYKKRGADCNFR